MIVLVNEEIGMWLTTDQYVDMMMEKSRKVAEFEVTVIEKGLAPKHIIDLYNKLGFMGIHCHYFEQLSCDINNGWNEIEF